MTLDWKSFGSKIIVTEYCLKVPGHFCGNDCDVLATARALVIRFSNYLEPLFSVFHHTGMAGVQPGRLSPIELR